MNAPLDSRRIELLDPDVVAILKTKTPAEKLAMAFDAHGNRIAGRSSSHRIHLSGSQPACQNCFRNRSSLS